MIFGNKLKQKMIEGMHDELLHKMVVNGIVKVDGIGTFKWEDNTIKFTPSLTLLNAVRKERRDAS